MRRFTCVLAIVASAALVSAQRAAKTLDIYVVDVEGGNATLFVAPSGESLLIDAGNGGMGAARDAGRIVEAAKDAGVTQIDHLIVTHWHGDHYGGMAEVLEHFPTRAFVYGGTSRAARSYRTLLAAIDRLGIPVVTADTGVRRLVLLTAADSVVLTILAPPTSCHALAAAAGGDEINNYSICVRLERRGFTMLFPGDAEIAELEWWMLTRRALLAANVLKASHHGSTNGTPPEWLDAVRPGAVVISANGRQHPFAEVLALLAARAIPSYCTADHGTITIRVPQGGAWTIVPERPGVCHARTVRGDR